MAVALCLSSSLPLQSAREEDSEAMILSIILFACLVFFSVVNLYAEIINKMI